MELKISKNLRDAMEKENHRSNVVSNRNDYLKPAGDLENSDIKYQAKIDDFDSDVTTEREMITISDNPTPEEMKEYLNKIKSGIKYDDVFAFGEGVISSGEEIVPFDFVVDMYNKGYNIVDTEYYNPDQVRVRYQDVIKKGRGR